ncbi:MAG: hypothetical protein EOP08_13625 [Proteobacteria bacterium]|nr:MAG: hypothetical protein EOP08_13625 [Pseudomonadota bacterium]
MTFTRKGLEFAADRAGTELENTRAVEIELDYDELGIDVGAAPEQLGAILSTLLGEEMADEEGIFDLVVHKDGVPVATLTLACEDDALEVVGERVAAAVAEADLAEALLDALPRS